MPEEIKLCKDCKFCRLERFDNPVDGKPIENYICQNKEIKRYQLNTLPQLPPQCLEARYAVCGHEGKYWEPKK